MKIGQFSQCFSSAHCVRGPVQDIGFIEAKWLLLLGRSELGVVTAPTSIDNLNPMW